MLFRRAFFRRRHIRVLLSLIFSHVFRAPVGSQRAHFEGMHVGDLPRQLIIHDSFADKLGHLCPRLHRNAKSEVVPLCISRFRYHAGDGLLGVHLRDSVERNPGERA